MEKITKISVFKLSYRKKYQNKNFLKIIFVILVNKKIKRNARVILNRLIILTNNINNITNINNIINIYHFTNIN